MRAGRLAALALACLAAAGACSRVPVPRVNLPGAGAANEGTARLIEKRVWVEDAQVPGYLAFLSDGTLVHGFCGGPMRLSAWRWIDDARLGWESQGEVVRAEIAEAGPGALVLLPESPEGSAARHFHAARPPEACGAGG